MTAKRNPSLVTFAATTAAILGVLAAGPAAAAGQAVCIPHPHLVDKLAKEFGETVTAAGFDGAGNLVQVFSSLAGTWTIAVSIPGGPTCVISAGEGWEKQDNPLPVAEAAS